MPKVSIIIPVYQAKETIAACLDSVIAQTMDDLEVLLVDDHGGDGSIDAAQQQIDDYAGPIRFRVLSTDVNSGPGVARNLGIRHATGEYVSFLDSDDTLDPAFCEKLYAVAHPIHADLVCCDALKHQAGKTDVLRNPAFPAGPISDHSRRHILRHVVTYLWTYLFRREFLLENGISFPPSRSAEDSCLVCCCWLSAHSAAHVDETLYHYTVAPASLSFRRDPLRWRQRLSSFSAFSDYARDKGLLGRYRCTIRWISFKKGHLMAVKDYIKNNL